VTGVDPMRVLNDLALAAWRNTSVNRTNGDALLAMMSASAWLDRPAPPGRRRLRTARRFDRRSLDQDDVDHGGLVDDEKVAG
jgi:hypothetical protein